MAITPLSGTPPSIAALLRYWDRMSTDTALQAQLRGLKTQCSWAPAKERERGFAAVDWFVRDHAPRWHEVAGRQQLADQFRQAKRICSSTSMAVETKAHAVAVQGVRPQWTAVVARQATSALIAALPIGLAGQVIDAAGDEARHQAAEAGWHALRYAAVMGGVNPAHHWETVRGVLIDSVRLAVWRTGLTFAAGAETDKAAIEAARAGVRELLATLVADSKASALAALQNMVGC